MSLKKQNKGRSAAGGVLYEKIASDILDRIRRGELMPGERLPTSRDLAATLGVNRNTVVRAYRSLSDRGAIASHTGRGTFVVDSTPDMPGGQSTAARESFQTLFARPVEEARLSALLEHHSLPSKEGAISFAGNHPAADIFPMDALGEAMERCLRRHGNRLFHYGPVQGDPELRQWIAEDLENRGMRVQASEIVITNGSQQAIDLVARALFDPEDTVLVENPCYSGAVDALRTTGARLRGISLDDKGLRPDLVDSIASRYRAKALFATPDFQNPSTSVMPSDRRLGLLDVASRRGMVLVEDDWACDLRFVDRTTSSLKALDRENRVVYISTFAKKLVPGLRIGFVCAPRPMVERILVLKQIGDCGTSPFLQSLLFEFCREGEMERHLKVVRKAYRKRRDEMVRSLKEELDPEVSFPTPPGGLFLWATLPQRANATSIAARAREEGVLVSRGGLFYLDQGGDSQLRLSYAAVNPEQIKKGIHKLAEVVREELERPTATDDERTRHETVPLV